MKSRVLYIILLLITFSSDVNVSASADYDSLVEQAAEAIFFDEDYSTAVSLLEQALEEKEDFKAYIELGRIYEHLNQSEKAAAAYVKAADLCDNLTAADAFLNAINVMESNGLDASSVYDRAFQWIENVDYYHDKFMTIYIRRMNYFIERSEGSKALEIALRHLQLMDAKGLPDDSRHKIKTISEVSRLASNIGDNEMLVKYGATLLDVLNTVANEKWSTSSTTIPLLPAVAEYLTIKGDYARADSVYRALINVKTGNDNRGANLTQYAIFLSNIGRSEESLEYLDSAASLYLESGMTAKAAQSLLDRASVAKRIKNWGEYKNSIDRSANLLPVIESDISISEEQKLNILLNVAQIASDAGEHDYAIDLYNKILPYYKGSKNVVVCARILNDIGYNYESMDDYNQALRYYDEAAETLHLEYYPDIQRSILSNKAGVLHKLGRDEESLKLYSVLLEMLNETLDNFVYMTEDERHEFWLNQYYIFDNIHGLPASINGVGKLRYQAALANKGILLDASTRLRNTIFLSGDSLLIRDFVTLNKKLGNPMTPAHKAEIRELERDIQRRASSLGNFKSSAVTVADVCRRLDENDIAVEIVRHVGPDHLYHYDALIADSRGNIVIEELPSQEYVESQDRSNIYNDPEGLASGFWNPIMRHSVNGGKIFISPDGVYHTIAFEHLPYNGKPVSRSSDVFRVSSTRKLLSETTPSYDDCSFWGGLDYNAMPGDYRKEHDGEHNSVELRVGSGMNAWRYLAGTAQEVENLETIALDAHKSVSLVMDDEGSEGAFKELSGHSPSILHIATHGFYMPSETDEKSNMLRSGLILSGANNAWREGYVVTDGVNDGILTSSEIAKLDFSSVQLAVLSACRSGLGDIESEGLFGLPRALKQSGVESIVMTLWPISDEATEGIMGAFYKNFLSGMNLHRALSAACVTDGGNDPDTWAAFVIID